MATAIREVELSEPLRTIEGLDGYPRAMLVLRWRARIVGRLFVEVSNGSVPAGALDRAVARGLTKDVWQSCLDDIAAFDERAVVESPPLTATVAICTRERPDDLRRALVAVAALEGDSHDVLVVDNAPSSDVTRLVVQQFPRIRYVCEPLRGLNAARNRALRESRGDVVAFTDDDAAPEPAWLKNLLVNFADPRVLCATGLTLPIELETEAQELFERHCPFARGFRRRVFDGHHDNPLHVGPVGAGANMALRKNVLARVGAFDERLDGGMPTRSGGDHEMFARILGAGYRIAYDPAAVSWHRHRRTMDELMDTVYGYGVGVYAMWTGMLLERRELGALKLAWSWFRHGQLPILVRAWRKRDNERQAELVRAELLGCLHGPRAWFAARRLRGAGA
jgi:cellulose synthase/poly-beta-1,6-N-acetylglucosamine synthase-like glycosyltransferase